MKRPKVLVIGIDGLRWDQVPDRAPRLAALRTAGLFGESLLDPDRGAQTVSGPGWSNLVCGVWPDKHGVRDNTFAGARYARYPDFLTRLARAGRTTLAALSWPPLVDEGTFGAENFLIRGDGETHTYAAEDARLAPALVDALRGDDHEAVFAYLGQVDEAGHDHGPLSAAYAEAVTAVDAIVGQLVDAVAARPSYLDEQWLIVVATDHGHRDSGGHGEFTEPERRTFLLVVGPGVPPGDRAGTAQVDLVPTLLQHLGVPIPSELDGRSLLGGPFAISGVVLDSPDAHELAWFYRRLLGWRPVHSTEDWIKLAPPGGGTGLAFQTEAGYAPPVWPAGPGDPQKMVHLDIAVDDLDHAVAFAVGLGARLAADQPQDDVRVLLDPAGHPFCLFQRR